VGGTLRNPYSSMTVGSCALIRDAMHRLQKINEYVFIISRYAVSVKTSGKEKKLFFI